MDRRMFAAPAFAAAVGLAGAAVAVTATASVHRAAIDVTAQQMLVPA